MFGQKNMLDAPYECFNAEYYTTNDISSMVKEDATYMLCTMNRIFKEAGITFMPAFGTLLGAVREHDFIAHDGDIDSVIWAEDLQKVMKLRPDLEKHDIHLLSYVLPWIISFRYKDIVCDIDILHEAIWPWRRWYCLMAEMYIPKSFFTNTKTMEFLGEQFIVPAETEKILVYHYGKDWRIPSSRQGRIESYFFFWRYAHRFMQRCKRYVKKHILKKSQQ